MKTTLCVKYKITLASFWLLIKNDHVVAFKTGPICSSETIIETSKIKLDSGCSVMTKSPNNRVVENFSSNTQELNVFS